jgi:hypothetical protein
MLSGWMAIVGNELKATNSGIYCLLKLTQQHTAANSSTAECIALQLCAQDI